MKPRVRRAAATLAILCFAGVALPRTAAADLGGLGVSPAHYDPANPVTLSYVIAQVGRGGSYSDQLLVTNRSNQAMSLIAAPVDGLTAVNSGAVYANRQDPLQRWGRWLTVGRSSFSVPAQSTVQLPFTARVPGDATAGDHLAGISVEDAQPQSSGSGSDVQVTTVYRVVIGVLIQVPGGAAFDVQAQDAAVGNDPQAPAIAVHLADAGLRLGKPDVTVFVKANDGSYRQQVTRSFDTFLPGDSIDYAFAWPDTPPTDPCIAVTVTGAGMDAAEVFTKGCPPGFVPPPPGTPVHPLPGQSHASSSPSPAPSGSPAPAGGAHGGGPHHGGGSAADGVAGAEAPDGGLPALLARLVPAIVGGASVPIFLLLLIAVFLAVQDRLDRGDPKLALAPVFADPDLPFMPPSHWHRLATAMTRLTRALGSEGAGIREDEL